MSINFEKEITINGHRVSVEVWGSQDFATETIQVDGEEYHVSSGEYCDDVEFDLENYLKGEFKSFTDGHTSWEEALESGDYDKGHEKKFNLALSVLKG